MDSREKTSGVHRTGRSPVAVLLLTVLGAVIPGSGLIAAGRIKSGIAVLVVAVAAVVGLILYVGTDLADVLSRALDERTLRRGAIAAIVVALAWSLVAILSHRALRPGSAGTGERVGGSILVGVLCLGISTPLVLGANVLLTTRTTLDHIFTTGSDQTAITDPNTVAPATRPTAASTSGATATAVATAPAGPTWSRRRLNVLLLGSDAALDRTGTRTDSMVIASIDTVTGKVLLVSVPRNLCRLAWNPTTVLGQLYPQGWTDNGGTCDSSGDNIINAIYNDVPVEHPGVLGHVSNEGADALSLGLQYSLGLKIDYYLLVNLDAFETIVNSIGGVTVNIDTPIPVGGQHDTLTGQTVTAYPTRWLMPGPKQHLDGKNALWYARGRFASDDYDRIARQKCMINAISTQANPTKVLTSYASLATTLQNDVLTNIPENLLNPLAQLSLRVKTVHKISGITIDPTSIPAMGSDVDDPDWSAVRAAVNEAIAATDPTTTASPTTPGSRSPSPSGLSSASPTASRPGPTVTATTSNGSNVTTSVAAGCGYDAVTARKAVAAWQAQYGGMYDSTGHRR